MESCTYERSSRRRRQSGEQICLFTFYVQCFCAADLLDGQPMIFAEGMERSRAIKPERNRKGETGSRWEILLCKILDN